MGICLLIILQIKPPKTNVYLQKHDTIPPYCNVTNVNDACDPDMCKCSKSYVTADLLIWDEGFGLKDITTSGIGDGAFAHTTFQLNQTKDEGVVNAELKYVCINTAFCRFPIFLL